MPAHDPPPAGPPTGLLAFSAGAVFVAALLALAVLIPNPTPTQFETFRIVIALAAGCLAAVIPGFLNLQLSAGKRFALQAGGALAVFAVIYFFSPARWVSDPAPRPTPPPGPLSQTEPHRELSQNNTSIGPFSPVIPDNRGTVNIQMHQGR